MAITKIDYESKEVQASIDNLLYGKSIYLLGTSDLGATNKPILINNEAELNKEFGLKGSLINSYIEVKKGSPESQVFLCKTSGTHSIIHLDVNIKNGDIVKDGFIIKAQISHQIYNSIKLDINENSIIFTFPLELGGGTKQYNYSDSEILGVLAKRINEDTDNGDNFVYAQCMVEPSTPIIGSLTVANANSIYMYGGDNGLICSKNLYYNCLEQTYSLLEGEEIDVLVPLEAFIDDVLPSNSEYGSAIYGANFYQTDRSFLNIMNGEKQTSFYEQLLIFCIKQMRYGLITHGVMGFNLTEQQILYDDDNKNYLLEIINYAIDSNLIDESFTPYKYLVSMVAGDLSYDNGLKRNNGYTFYAGLITSLSIAANTTNKSLDKSVYIYNEFSNEDLSYLSDLGVVTFRQSVLTDTAVVTSGVTTALVETDLHFLCNVRMIQLTLSYIKSQFLTYIGEDINELINGGIAQINLDALLTLLTKRGIITAFKTSIIKNDEIGRVTYYVDLKTIYMTEFIKVSGGITYKVR